MVAIAACSFDAAAKEKDKKEQDKQPKIEQVTTDKQPEQPVKSDKEVIEALNKQVADLQNTVNKLSGERDAAKNDANTFQNRYDDMRDQLKYKNFQIDSLNKSISAINKANEENIKNLNDRIADRNSKLILMASNFLYIPYEDYSVNEIAIPAFEGVDDDVLKKENAIYIDLLKNYKSDIDSLCTYIDVVMPRTKLFNLESSRVKEANNLLKEFKNHPTVARYLAYEDWEETWLGKYIKEIQKVWTNPGDKTATENKLKEIQASLKSVTK